MKRFIAILLTLMMVMVFASCGGSKDTVVPQNASSSEGNKGGSDALPEYKDTIIFSANKDASSLDVQFANDAISWCVTKMLFSNLVKFDENDEIVGDLADSWELSEDKLTWTFKLKEGVKFHDGKALTANDVKATFDRALVPANGFPVTGIINMVDKAEVIDDLTVAISTKYSYGPLLQLFASPFLGILDEEYFNKYGASFGMNVESVNGTGPYRLKSWDIDEELVLVRNEDYFGEKAPTENIVMKPIPDSSARVIALETGEVDMIYGIPTVDIERLSESKDLQIISKSSIGVKLFRFGCNDSIMQNSKVRQAINYAVDRHEIYEACYKGIADVSTAPMTPVIWGYKNLGVIEQDLEKAKTLMEEAGYPDGFETKIVTTPFYDKSTEAAEIMAEQLSKIGITAKIEVLEWSTHVAQRSGLTPEEFDWPIFFMGMGSATGDADGMMRGLLTTTETGTNVRNYGFYSNKEFDELVFEAMGETDPDKRKELYDKASEIIYFQDPPGVYIADTLIVVGASNKLENPTISKFAYFTFENARLKK